MKYFIFLIITKIFLFNFISAQSPIPRSILINLKKGWNLVATPLPNYNTSSTVVFSGATSQVFEYSNGYSTTSVVNPKKGYWVKYVNDALKNNYGSPINSHTIPIKNGWNLISGFDYNVNTSDILISNGNIISQFFNFDNTYLTSNILEPTKAYWIKVNSDGFLYLPLFQESPENNSKNLESKVNFKWRKSDEAISYTLEIADNISFIGAMQFTNITTTNKVVEGLSYNKKYYWRVNAVNNATISKTPFQTIETKSKQSKLVTPEYLGNPYAALHWYGGEYSNNLWVVYPYNGKVYVGAGNSANSGPRPNQGPVPVIRYNPATNKFEKGANWSDINDEQIDVYYTFNNKLWIPGHDPKESGSSNGTGNVYFMHDEVENRWTKYRNLPGEVHTYAMAEFDNKLFAAGYYTYSSVNWGQNWKVVRNNGSSRMYSFLCFADQLYSIGTANSFKYIKRNETFVYSPEASYDKRFPNTNIPSLNHYIGKIIRPQMLKGINEYKNIFIGAVEHNNHQSLPFCYIC